MSIQALLIEAGALGLFCSTIVLVRSRLLSIRYGLGWIAVSIAGLAGGPLLAILAREAKKIGFTPTGFSLGVLIAFLCLLCLQLSVSLSGLHRAIQDLTEHAALVEERLRRVEESSPRIEGAEDTEDVEDGYARFGGSPS